MAPSKLPMVTSKQFSVFFSQKVRYPCIIRISYNALLSASLLLEYQYLHGQTDLHYLIFLTILMDKLYIIQLDKFTLSFISNRIKPFNDTFQIPPLIFMGQVLLDICLYFLRLIYWSFRFHFSMGLLNDMDGVIYSYLYDLSV